MKHLTPATPSSMKSTTVTPHKNSGPVLRDCGVAEEKEVISGRCLREFSSVMTSWHEVVLQPRAIRPLQCSPNRNSNRTDERGVLHP